MDNIRQRKHNESPILNFNKILYRQFLNNKLDTHVEKSIVFKALKNKQCIILRNIISGNNTSQSN